MKNYNPYGSTRLAAAQHERVSGIRISIVFMLFSLIYFISLFNLFLTQIIQHDFYTDLAQRQYQTTITSHPARGTIYDRNGNALAINKESMSAFITPRSLKQSKKVQAFLHNHFPKAHKRLQKNKKKHFMYVKRKLSQKEQLLIEQSNIKDIKLLKEASRFYPITSCATITGITDIDNKGLSGIEYTHNNRLTGKPTTHLLAHDGRSKRFYTKKETTAQGSPGNPITLTIDSTLQFLATEQLEKTVKKFNAKQAACVIMNPNNGDILAMSQWPHLDPNNTKNLDISLTKNTCITEGYELGSVIKACAALAALQEKVVEPNELIDCENVTSTILDGRPINTVYPAGEIPFWRVLVVSNNIGMAKVAKRLGEKLYDYYTQMGFEKKTGIALPGEQSGFVQDPKNWSKQSLISLSYGYEIRTTLLQLARFFSMVANGGYDVTPRLVMENPSIAPTAPLRTSGKEIKSDHPERSDRNREVEGRLFSPRPIKTMQEILKRTAPWRAQIKGYTVMGKTGTANTLVDGAYDETKNLYTFGGIIRKGDYKRVIVTFVKETDRSNIYASQVAAPLFKNIAERLLVHDRAI